MIISRPDFLWTWRSPEDEGLPASQQTEFVFRLPTHEETAWFADRAAQPILAFAPEIVRALLMDVRKLEDVDGKPVTMESEGAPPTLMGQMASRQQVPSLMFLRRFGPAQLQQLAQAAVRAVPVRATEGERGK